MPHWPQPGAGSEANSALPPFPELATAKADNCCSSRVLSHFGQCGFSDPRTRTSNCFPQPLHRNSKIGIDPHPVLGLAHNGANFHNRGNYKWPLTGKHFSLVFPPGTCFHGRRLTAMDATVSAELGAEDAHLEVPWQAGDVRYYDLRRHPELLLELPESQNREMGEFLAAMNSPLSMLETAKCDTWLSDRMEAQEAVFAASWKFGSYVDLIFTDPKARPEFAGHENFAKRVARLLRRAPDIPSAAEFIVRRCHYAPSAAGAGTNAGSNSDVADGFCLTFYLFGYGDDEDEARRRWGIALKVVENALLQLSGLHRRGSDQTAPLPPETMRALRGAG